MLYNGRRNNEKNKEERLRHVFQQQRNRESRGWSERPSIPSNGSVTKLAVPRSAWIIRRQQGGGIGPTILTMKRMNVVFLSNFPRDVFGRRTCSTSLSKKVTLKGGCESHNVPKIINDSWAAAHPLYGVATHRHPSSCVSNSIRDLARVD